MEGITSKSANWNEGEWPSATLEPGVSVEVMIEGESTLTVATIVAVTLVVILAIVAFFVLGVLIDCRQQRIQDEQMEHIKRLKTRRGRSNPEDESVSIAVNMEEPGLSPAPAEALRDTP